MLPFGVKKKDLLRHLQVDLFVRETRSAVGGPLKQVGTIRCKKHIFLDPQILEIGREMFCIYDINCDPSTIYNQDSLDACGLLESVDSCRVA